MNPLRKNSGRWPWKVHKGDGLRRRCPSVHRYGRDHLCPGGDFPRTFEFRIRWGRYFQKDAGRCELQLTCGHSRRHCYGAAYHGHGLCNIQVGLGLLVPGSMEGSYIYYFLSMITVFAVWEVPVDYGRSGGRYGYSDKACGDRRLRTLDSLCPGRRRRADRCYHVMAGWGNSSEAPDPRRLSTRS